MRVGGRRAIGRSWRGNVLKLRFAWIDPFQTAVSWRACSPPAFLRTGARWARGAGGERRPRDRGRWGRGFVCRRRAVGARAVLVRSGSSRDSSTHPVGHGSWIWRASARASKSFIPSRSAGTQCLPGSGRSAGKRRMWGSERLWNLKGRCSLPITAIESTRKLLARTRLHAIRTHSFRG
jgi:hypothetical protein